jgi:hypothetical protein
MDMSQVNNYDSNAQAGTPSTGCWQMIPSTFAAYADPSCTDPNDALCQAMSSINYQEAVHGGPVWNSGYASGGIASLNGRPTLPMFRKGGVVPGAGPMLSLLHGGERVLTGRENGTLEALASNPAAGGPGGSSSAGSGGSPYSGVDNSQQNHVEVNVYVEGGVSADNADALAQKIGATAGAEVVNIMGRVNNGTGSRKAGVAKGFS